MESATELIERYRKADWFTKVGQLIEDKSIVRVSSWDEAIATSRAKYPGDWADMTLEAMNIVGHEVQRHDRAQYQEWNAHVDWIKAQLGFLKVKVLNSPLKESDISFTVLGACIEAVYGGIVETKLLRDICEWFVKGHFPCGWEGEDFIGGKLIVY